MVLGYMQQMEDPILQGTKIHTCRDTKNNFRPGMFMDFVIGNRTPGRRIFAQKICTGVQPVKIWHDQGNIRIEVDGRPLTNNEISLFIVNDGFESGFEGEHAFINYFCIKMTHGGLGFICLTFTGKLIHWTDFKY